MLYLLHDTLYFRAEPVGAKTSKFYEDVIFSVPGNFGKREYGYSCFLLK